MREIYHGAFWGNIIKSSIEFHHFFYFYFYFTKAWALVVILEAILGELQYAGDVSCMTTKFSEDTQGFVLL